MRPKKSNDEMFDDFRSAFDWVDIEKTKSEDSNTELAELEGEDETLECIVIVPLDKIYIQNTLVLGKYTFVCRKQFDEEPYERLADFEEEYLQFEVSLSYKDLLWLNESVNQNDHVINKCLSLEEHAMDIVRFAHSSFVTREFTPNPAGQMVDGFVL